MSCVLCPSVATSDVWCVVGDARQLEVFHHQCLSSIFRIRWSDQMSSAQVTNLVFGAFSENALS